MNFYENLLINEINYIVSSKQTFWMVSIILIDLLKWLRKEMYHDPTPDHDERNHIPFSSFIHLFTSIQFNQSVHCLLTLFVGILQLFYNCYNRWRSIVKQSVRHSVSIVYKLAGICQIVHTLNSLPWSSSFPNNNVNVYKITDPHLMISL